MISGANRGIGKAIREKLQSENYLLSLGLRNPSAFKDSMKQHETEIVHLHEYDARNPESGESWVRSTLEHFGTIDGLVNNAGIVSGAPLLQTKDEKIIKTFEVPLTAPPPPLAGSRGSTSRHTALRGWLYCEWLTEYNGY